MSLDDIFLRERLTEKEKKRRRRLRMLMIAMGSAGGGSSAVATTQIELSADSLAENSAEGTAIGTLSVSNGTGTYTFSLTDSATNKAKVAGTNGVNLQAGSSTVDYETTTDFNITVSATNGVDTPITRTFSITVTNVAESASPDAPTLTWASDSSDTTPEFTFGLVGIVAGDIIQFQTQVDAGDWSSATTTNHTITQAEFDNNLIDLGLAAFADGSYEARARVSKEATPTLWSDWSNVVDFTIAAVTEDAATTAWAAQVTTNGGTVGATRRGHVNDFIVAVKAAGLWTGLDRYWLLAGEDAASARTDLKGLALATITGAPTFTASQGYSGGSSSNYVDFGFNPGTHGVGFVQDSCVFGGQIQTNRTIGNDNPTFGMRNADETRRCDLYAHNSIPISLGVINSGSSYDLQAPSTTSLGSWLLSRTASNALKMYRNGTSIATATTASIGVISDATFCFGALRVGPTTVYNASPDQASSFFVGAGWSDAQASAFEAAQQALMTAIGINVY